MKPEFPRGLYVITDRRLCARIGVEAAVRAALRGGAVIVQYRDKSEEHDRRRQEAVALSRTCRESNALFIVNDDPDLARVCNADGVHLGKGDTDPGEARRIVGAHALIGVSCYDSLERAREAVGQGCDYVAFGSAYPSTTKPHAVRAAPELFAQAVRELRVPVVAIGGITPGNGGALLTAGCRALAVISGVFGQVEPEMAARRYARLFSESSPPDQLE